MVKTAEEMKKYPKLVGDGPFTFVYRNGRRTKNYYMAYEYECDWTGVKTDIFNGEFYLRHYETGELVGPFAFFEPYNHGHFIVKKEPTGKAQYVNEECEFSEEFYRIRPYIQMRDADGYVVSTCQKEKDGPWYFRDVAGNLSEPYDLIKVPIGGRFWGRKKKDEFLMNMSATEIRQSIARAKAQAKAEEQSKSVL